MRPLLRSSPRRGAERVLLLPGILGLIFAWGGGGLDQSESHLPASRGRSPRAGSCLYVAQKLLVWVL